MLPGGTRSPSLRASRTGTLWEGRYKSCLVDCAGCFLRCVRYIDLNPVRARMTDDPARYPWSSCAALCGERDDALLTLHPAQLALGATDRARGDAYCALLAETMNLTPFGRRRRQPSSFTAGARKRRKSILPTGAPSIRRIA